MRTIQGFPDFLLTETDRVVTKEGEFIVEPNKKIGKYTLKNEKGDDKTVSMVLLIEMSEPIEEEEATAPPPPPVEPDPAPEKPAENEKSDAAKAKGKKLKAVKKDDAPKAEKKPIAKPKAAPKEKVDTAAKDKPKSDKKVAREELKKKAAEWVKTVNKGDEIPFTPFGKDKAIKGTVKSTYGSTNNPGAYYVVLIDSDGKKYDKVATSLMPEVK